MEGIEPLLNWLTAAGLRASELCFLKVSDLDAASTCFKGVARGEKRAWFPFWAKVRQATLSYIEKIRPQLDKIGSPHLFLSRTGRPLLRAELWRILKKRGKRAGILILPYRACIAPLLRDAFITPRHGSANIAGVVGACVHIHYGALHTLIWSFEMYTINTTHEQKTSY